MNFVEEGKNTNPELSVGELLRLRSNELAEAALRVSVIAPSLERVARQFAQIIEQRRTIFACGNGGSAADAQHFAGELVGRFKVDRRGLPALALTTDGVVMTAISNDYSFRDVFSRQLEAIARPGDGLLAISTSGRSANILAALARGRELGMYTVLLTGEHTGGSTHDVDADEILRVPATDTSLIQELHILVIHTLCEWIERLAMRQPRSD